MNQNSICLGCEAPLDAGAREGFCAQCLFSQVASELFQNGVLLGEGRGRAPAPDFPRPGYCFADYELIREVGRGGMGIVFQARQLSLDREVAVKLLFFGPMARSELVQRLRLEAVLTAALRHPNIVTVHEAGIHADQHYLVMDYIPGPNLEDMAANRPLSPKHAAGLVKTIAQAVQFAHERGILHRDLKPSNILVEPNGQPRISDFGLAKRVDPPPGEEERQQDPGSPSPPGRALGSPNYMSPEQAAGSQTGVGRLTDVYALGAILYYLLTTRPPFSGKTIADTLRLVREAAAVSPRSYNPRIPPGLEAICLKCLEKEPERRYATAQEVADELDRFLQHKPLRVLALGPVQEFTFWCRRNAALAGLGLGALFLLFIVLAGWPLALRRIRQARAQAEAQRRSASRSGEEVRALLYDAKMSMAQHAWEEKRFAFFSQLLDETRGYPERGFEWRFWQRQRQLLIAASHGVFGSIVPRGHSSPLGRSGAATRRRSPSMWRATRQIRSSQTQQATDKVAEAGRSVAVLSADGRVVATTRPDGAVWIVGASALGHPRHLIGWSSEVWAMTFSPDGRTLATAAKDGLIQLWDASTGRQSRRLGKTAGPAQAIIFSPDGRWLASGGAGGNISLWLARSGTLEATLKGPRAAIAALAFAPDGGRLASGDCFGTVTVWSLARRRRILTVDGDSNRIVCITFSPNGKQILIGDEGNPPQIRDAATGQKLISLLGYENAPCCLAFSPDGHRVLTAGEDGRTRLWDARTGEMLLELPAQGRKIMAIRFLDGGSRIATASADGSVTLWKSASHPALPRRSESVLATRNH